MYCSSCGSALAQNVSYCNRCGAKVSGAKVEAVAKSSEIKTETLVSSMVALFIFGLGAIAVLIGVLKQVAGFELPLLLAVILLSFLLLLVVEGVLIGLLLKGRKGAAKEKGDAERLKEPTTRELGEAHPQALPEAVPSVTEHTTRAFEPLYSERQSK
jgi:hypothetical protein